MQFELHSGRIVGATQLASQCLSELQIQRAGRSKSRAFMTYLKGAGEEACSVAAALAKRRILFVTAWKRRLSDQVSL